MYNHARKDFPDLRTTPLEDIIKIVRGVPWSEWLFEQLDRAYLNRFNDAQAKEDFVELRDHISFMLTYFMPQHHIEVLSKARNEGRWSVVARLCEMKAEISLPRAKAEIVPEPA